MKTKRMWSIILVGLILATLIPLTNVLAVAPTPTAVMDTGTFPNSGSLPVYAAGTYTTNNAVPGYSFLTNNPGVSASFSNGELVLPSTQTNSILRGSNGTGASTTAFKSKITQPVVVFETKMKVTATDSTKFTSASMIFPVSNGTTQSTNLFGFILKPTGFNISVGNSWLTTYYGSFATNTYYKLKMVADFSAGNVMAYINDQLVTSTPVTMYANAKTFWTNGNLYLDYTSTGYASIANIAVTTANTNTLYLDYFKVTSTTSTAKSATMTLGSPTITTTGTTQATLTVKDALSGGNTIAAGNYAATYWSDNTAVATVNSSGLITGVAIGSANIYADVDGVVIATAPVTVGAAVTSVTVSPKPLNLNSTIFETGLLTATVLPAEAPNRTVSWTSSDSTVATVSSSGLVTALKPGDITITATSVADGTKTDTCAVHVTSGYMCFNNTVDYASVPITNAVPFNSSTNGNGLYFNNNSSTATVSVVTDAAASNSSALKMTSSGQAYGAALSRFFQNIPNHTGNVFVIENRAKLVGDTSKITARWWVTFGALALHMGFSTVSTSDGSPFPNTVAGNIFSNYKDTGYAYSVDTWYTFRMVMDYYGGTYDLYIKPDGASQFTKIVTRDTLGVPQSRASSIGFVYSNPGATATSGMLLDDINVYGLNVDSIALSPNNTSSSPLDLKVAATQQYTATSSISQAAGTPVIDMPLYWSSGTSATATTTSSGLVTGVAKGVTTITARVGMSPNIVSSATYVNVYKDNCEISSISYTDGAGVTTSTIPVNGQVKVNINLSNYTATDFGSTMVISALYDINKNLLAVSMPQYTQFGANAKLNGLQNIINTPAAVPVGSFVKTFVWKEANIMPVVPTPIAGLTKS